MLPIGRRAWPSDRVFAGANRERSVPEGPAAATERLGALGLYAFFGIQIVGPFLLAFAPVQDLRMWIRVACFGIGLVLLLLALLLGTAAATRR